MKVETVVGASKREQLVTEAPSSVSIVTAEDIATFGWRTLADVLKSVRGLYVTNDRNYSYLGVQGFGRPTDYNNRVLFLIDGHRVNDNVYDGTLIGTEFPVDVDLIDRIEVIRGPGSALYGTSAFFGVVNIITKKGAAVGGIEGAIDVGSDGLFRARGSYGTTGENGRQLLMSATRYSSDGSALLYYPEFDNDDTNFGVSQGHDQDAATSLYGSYRSGGLALQGLYSRRAKHVPTGSWWTRFNDPRMQTIDSRGWLDLTQRFAFAGANLTARAAYDHTYYEGTYPYDESDNVFRDFARGDWLSTELMGERALTEKVRLVGGVEYKTHLAQDQWAYYATTPDVMDVEARSTSWQYAGYAQADIAVTRRVTLMAGARYDSWSALEGSAVPRAGLIVKVGAEGSLKILYGGAFRAPSVYEMFYFPNQAATSPLRSENVRTSEIVCEQYVGRRLRLTGVTFYTRITDLISQVETTDEVTHVNKDHVDSKGAAAEAEIRWASGVLVRGAYSFQAAREHVSGVTLSNAPRHLLSLNASTPIVARRGTAALDLTRVSSRLTNANTVLPASWLANITVNYRLAGSRVAIAGSINNLLDARYGHPVGGEFRQAAIEQNGRSYAVRTIIRF